MDAQFSQYQKALSQAARPLLAGVAPATRTLSVALAAPAAQLLLGEHTDSTAAGLVAGFRQLAAWGGSPEPQAGPLPPAPKMVDGQGHSRTVYHPLVLHLHLRAFRMYYEKLTVAQWGICEEALPAALAPVRRIEHFAAKAPPAVSTATTLWQALCLLEGAMALSREADVELVDAVVGAILGNMSPLGGLSLQGPEETLDAWTYRELTGLHALANLALIRRDATWAKAAAMVAHYHLYNTQPDHVTGQPWGIFAFLWTPATRSFGDQQLHDASAYSQGSSAIEGEASRSALVAGLLLADAAASLEAFAQVQK